MIERVWLALLMAVGFAGMVKLGRALRIGNEPSRLLAAAIFVLWPTFTIVIGSTSAAALPGLVVPWAILPLVPAADGRASPSRAAHARGSLWQRWRESMPSRRWRSWYYRPYTS